jgi:mevalonate kinase
MLIAVNKDCLEVPLKVNIRIEMEEDILMENPWLSQQEMDSFFLLALRNTSLISIIRKKADRRYWLEVELSEEAIPIFSNIGDIVNQINEALKKEILFMIHKRKEFLESLGISENELEEIKKLVRERKV